MKGEQCLPSVTAPASGQIRRPKRSEEGGEFGLARPLGARRAANPRPYIAHANLFLFDDCGTFRSSLVFRLPSTRAPTLNTYRA